MDSTFHAEERRPRTVLSTRGVSAEERLRKAEEDRRRVIGAVVKALKPFPEARSAVLAALAALRRRDTPPMDIAKES